jgi:hypothetical protein
MTSHRAASLLSLLLATPAWAQLDQSCTVSALNRTAPVDANGVWVLTNVPAGPDQVRVRATCVANGVTRSGQSGLITIPANGVITVDDISFAQLQPIPTQLTLTAPATSLSGAGQQLQLTATATYPDGTQADVTPTATGTGYRSSNSSIATVDANGLVTARLSGVVMISALNEGALGVFRLQVVLSGSTVGDGIPDDWKIAHGLDPNDPYLAMEDPDHDGLTNLEEYQYGTDPNNPDTDGDGLSDGDEVHVYHTNPLLWDTDGDGISDGVEVRTGSDPLDIHSFNLAAALSSITVSPTSFRLIYNTVVGESSRQLQALGNVIDGRTIDLFRPLYQTAVTSSDLTVASFGADLGRVYAGQDGTATVTVSNAGHSAAATVTVQTFSPTALAFLPLPGFANAVDVAGSQVYVAAGAGGLEVVDVSSLQAPTLVGSLATPGNADDVRVAAGVAYVADETGLVTADVRDPSHPALLGRLAVAGKLSRLAVQGTLVYAADRAFGLRVFDVTDPTQPVAVGALALPGDPRAVSLTGSLAVVACGKAGIAVVDVSQPQAPVLLGSTATRPDGSSVASSVTARGHLAYVADGAMGIYGGLKVIELRDPTNPVVVGGSPDNLSFGLTRVALEDGFALAAEFFLAQQLEIFDVGALPVRYAAPVSPASQFAGPPRASDVAVRQGAFFETANLDLIDFGTSSGGGGLFTGIYRFPVDYGTSPPTVSITAPQAGASAPARLPLTVAAAASDEVSVVSVAFLVNGLVVDTAYKAPFQTSYLVPSGAPRLLLRATATAISGLQATSPEVVVNGTPNSLPAVSLLAPVTGQTTVVGQTLVLAAQASADRGVNRVEFYVNGQLAGAPNTPPYRVAFVVPDGPATISVTATAYDDFGPGNAAGPVVVAVVPDQPPVVGILTPADGAQFVQGATIDVLVGASDDTAVASVHLLINGTEVGSVSQVPYLFTIPGPAAGQSKRLQAVAFDTAGLLANSPEIAVSGIGDAGTTVAGRVVTAQGPVAAGAKVSCAGVAGVADAQGAFRFGPVPTAQARISCTATFQDALGHIYSGVAAAVPVRGGVTDMGTITVLRGFLFPGPKLAMGPSSSPVDVVVADLNGDGILDLLMADGTGLIEVRLGNADGSYQDLVSYDVGAQSLAVGDFNRDGFLDVAGVNEAGVVSILLGKGDGTFQPPQTMQLQGSGSKIVAADLNGDGILDLAVAAEASSYPVSFPGAVWVGLGQGDGTFTFSQLPGGGASGLAVADVDGNGKLDLVAALGFLNPRGRGLAVYLGNGDGSFQNPLFLNDPSGPVAVAARDLNRDGLPDLVAAEGALGLGGVAVFLGTGQGYFAAPVYLKGDIAQADAVTVGDVDGDGIPDIVAAHRDDDQLSLYLGLGDGTFRPERILYSGSGPTAVAIADLNRDGIPDVVAANYYSSDLSLLYGQGSGSFPQQLRFAAGVGAQAVTLGDFNRDGLPDLAVASNSTDEVAVLLGGGGTFLTERRFATGSSPWAVAAGDFNGDGIPDLVTVNFGSDDVSVLLGAGDGTFAAARATAVGSGPVAVATADLNGDGKLDAVTANSYDDTVTVLLGAGDGTFASTTTYDAGFSPAAVALGDFNGDGKLDLAVADNTSPGAVSVLLGNGDGTFQAALSSPALDFSNALAVADLDGDGKADLVVTGIVDYVGAMIVLLGNGDGTFRQGTTYPTGPLPSAVVLADVNGDGILDIVLSDQVTDDTWVFLGNGDGTFQKPQTYAAGLCPYGLAVGDVNGDGKPDLVTANYCSDGVSVLLHQ